MFGDSAPNLYYYLQGQMTVQNIFSNCRGEYRDRTGDLRLAKPALSQLS